MKIKNKKGTKISNYLLQGQGVVVYVPPSKRAVEQYVLGCTLEKFQ